MIIGKKRFSWNISQSESASLQQQENGMYVGEIRSRNDNSIVFVKTCLTCADFYRSLQEREEINEITYGCEDCKYYNNHRCKLWNVCISKPDDSHCESLQRK